MGGRGCPLTRSVIRHKIIETCIRVERLVWEHFQRAEERRVFICHRYQQRTTRKVVLEEELRSLKPSYENGSNVRETETDLICCP
jgi:hypothetical protein